MIANGEIAFTGPLTREQQIKLYEASLFFIAPTYEQSKQMSVLINNARFSDPNTTCGPLSIAILQKAGILSEDLVAHDFFLINPDLGKDRITIKTVFPRKNIQTQDIKYESIKSIGTQIRLCLEISFTSIREQAEILSTCSSSTGWTVRDGHIR